MTLDKRSCPFRPKNLLLFDFNHAISCLLNLRGAEEFFVGFNHFSRVNVLFGGALTGGDSF